LPSPSAAGRIWERPATLTTLVCAVAVGVMLPSLTHQPVLDDAALLSPAALPGAGDLAAHFGRGLFGGVRPYGGYYRPLTTLSLAWGRDLFGGGQRAQHAVNIGLHAAVAASAFLLLRRLLQGVVEKPVQVACAAALLFATHPVAVDAVDPVTGRGDLLAALLLLLAWDRFEARRRGAGSLLALVGGAACFAGALAAKETAVVLPLLLLCGGVAEPHAARRVRWAPDLVLLLAILAAYLGIRTAVLGGWMEPGLPDPLDNPAAGVGTVARLAAASTAWLQAAVVLVWPSVLSPDYSGEALRPALALGDPRALAGLGVAVLLAVGWVAATRRGGGAAIAIPLLVLPYLPGANLFFAAPILFAVRLLYLPLLGFALLVVSAVAFLLGRFPGTRPGRGWAGAVLLGVGVATLSSVTLALHPYYRDDLTVWDRATQVGPQNAKAWYNLGNAWMRRGEAGNASAAYERSVGLRPGLGIAWANLGAARAASGDLASGEAAFRRALEVDPSLAQPHAALGALAAARGEIVEARRHLRTALVLDPALPDAGRIRALLATLDAGSP
jgi:tetratricopeptide (TPR) repeat protein